VDDAAPSELPQYNRDEALSALSDASAQMDEADFDLESVVQVQEDGIRVCADCRRPLKLDPDIGEMCIYLHALRYHSPSMGTYETEEPEWAHESWRPRPRSEI
jgi:exonuclease VII small subunit